MDNPEYAELIRHGWVDCQSNERQPDDRPCWHHSYFNRGNEPYSTDDAKEETKRIGARLAACAAGSAPDEGGFPDSYSKHFSWEERVKKAQNYRAKIGWVPHRAPLRKWINKGSP